MPAARSFAQLVSLACHDLRTPLATVHGFARTLERLEPLSDRTLQFVGIMAASSAEMAELLERLALVARIERGAYDPNLQPVDSLELARGAARRIDGERVSVQGDGTAVRADSTWSERLLAAFYECALRHGDADRLECAVRGADVSIGPVTADTGAVLLGEELRDFGAVVARTHFEALGGDVAVDGDALRVRLAT